jgi:methanogenic corrinoid protein MtbC1
LTESDQCLQNVTLAIVSGKAEEARKNTYASLAKGSSVNEVLDVVLEAANILFDLTEIGEADQSKLLAAEAAISSSLDAVQNKLSETEKTLGLKATVGPIELDSGHLFSLATSALLRSAGFQCVRLGKTKTPLELLRNSEELGANLVIPLLSVREVESKIKTLVEEIDRGGFRSKFAVVPVILGLEEDLELPIHVVRNSGELLSEALQLARKRKKL